MSLTAPLYFFAYLTIHIMRAVKKGIIIMTNESMERILDIVQRHVDDMKKFQEENPEEAKEMETESFIKRYEENIQKIQEALK